MPYGRFVNLATLCASLRTGNRSLDVSQAKLIPNRCKLIEMFRGGASFFDTNKKRACYLEHRMKKYLRLGFR